MFGRVLKKLKEILKPAGPRPVNWGGLRKTEPVSRVFGLDRGKPIDRYYIENFLERHASDVRGCVLEVGDATYTRRYGGERVTQSEVLHATADSPVATIVGDLVSGAGIPRESFDCMILTQVIPFLSDFQKGIRTIYQGLRRGGTALVTVPGISQISRYDMDRWGDYWRFTDLSAKQCFGDVFGPENVRVEVFGNVLAATAFLQGICVEELTPKELDVLDADYQVTLTIRAVKQEAGTAQK